MTIKIITPAKETLNHTFGGIYCDKGCGFKCTKEQYDAAFEACHNALLQMQKDGINRDGQWQGQVWDNCGWHWRITSGGGFGWQLRLNDNGTWSCSNYHEIDIPAQVSTSGHSTPIEAIRTAIMMLNAMIDKITYERKRLTDGIL